MNKKFKPLEVHPHVAAPVTVRMGGNKYISNLWSSASWPIYGVIWTAIRPIHDVRIVAKTDIK